MTVGDYTVKFDVERFGIRVTSDEVDEWLDERQPIDDIYEEDRRKAAEQIAHYRFMRIVCETVGQVDKTAYKTIHEGPR